MWRTSRLGWRDRVLASTGVASLALVLYANTLSGDFAFDDHAAIQVNADVRSSTPLSSVFSNDFWGLPLSDPESHKSYRPLTVLSFRLNHHLHGLWSPGFHCFNIAAHCAVCLLFLWACLGFGFQWAHSLTASLLFAAHPIHTEAVANIVGRSELLAAIFFLLALISYQRAVKTGTRHFVGSLAWVCMTIAMSLVSLLCKEQGITALGLCLVCESASLVKDVRSNHQKCREYSHSHRYRPVLFRVSLLVMATITLLIVRICVIGRGIPTFIDSDNPASFSPHFITRLLTYSYLCAVNVWLLLCPSCLCHDWSMGSIPLVESIADLRNIATLSLLAASFGMLASGAFRSGGDLKVESKEDIHCSVNSSSNRNQNNNIAALNTPHNIVTYCRRIRKPGVESEAKSRNDRSKFLLLVAASWTVIPFLPASNFPFPVGFVVAERVLYLPSMGFCLLVSLGFHTYCNSRRLGRWSVLALSLLLLVFSAKTVSRNAEWQSAGSIAHSALSVNPGNAKVLMGMGNELAQQGDRRCEWFYREAVRLRPQYSSAWANLGLVLINTDRPREAEEAYLTALSYKPDHINANTNMGHLCRLQRRWEEAQRYFMEALKRRPKLPTLHYYVGVASEELGDVEEAEREYALALQYNPHYWEAHWKLGHLLTTTITTSTHTQPQERRRERLERALFHYKKATSLKNDDPEIQQELDALLSLLRKVNLSPPPK